MKKGIIWPVVLGVVVLVSIFFISRTNFLNRSGDGSLTRDRDVIENWELFEDNKRGFSLRYPKELELEVTKGGFFLRSRAANIFWFSILENKQKLPPVNFWAEDYPFWDHAGETLEMSEQERLDKAKQYLDGAKKIDIGGQYEGYRMVVPDVLTRVEIFWFMDNQVFNFGYSPDDNSGGYPGEERNEIAEKILSTFSITN